LERVYGGKDFSENGRGKGRLERALRRKESRALREVR